MDTPFIHVSQTEKKNNTPRLLCPWLFLSARIRILGGLIDSKERRLGLVTSWLSVMVKNETIGEDQEQIQIYLQFKHMILHDVPRSLSLYNLLEDWLLRTRLCVSATQLRGAGGSAKTSRWASFTSPTLK